MESPAVSQQQRDRTAAHDGKNVLSLGADRDQEGRADLALGQDRERWRGQETGGGSEGDRHDDGLA